VGEQGGNAHTLGTLVILPLLHSLEGNTASEGFMAKFCLVRVAAVQLISLLACLVFVMWSAGSQVHCNWSVQRNIPKPNMLIDLEYD
jgi:hypothetical protein